MALVSVERVWKTYRSGLRAKEHAVVEDVSFSIEPGETLGLVGESGSGKTTVARMILGLTKPTKGRVLVEGVDVAAAGPSQLRTLRRRMQPVFQDPFAALNPRMKVLELISEPWRIHRHADKAEKEFPCTPSEEKEKTVELLHQVGLDDSALSRYPHEFSGGQRQRINIARALALRPRLLILDEPVSALDVSVGAQIVNLLRDLRQSYGLTCLFISHSMPLVRYLSTHIAVMEHGRLVETGEAEALCASPQQPYTQRLLAATPELPEHLSCR